jgi:Spy/CpxP family protein refolding chaperone
MSKILTLTATGVAGLVLGAGIGVAAAATDQGNRPAGAERVQDVSSMDEMHDAMRDQMPADLVEQCDQMHAAMTDGDHAPMMGSMGSIGSIMSGTGAAMPDGHAEHHPGTEG